MASARSRTLATQSTGPGPASRLPHAVGADLSLIPGARGRQGVSRYFLVDMHGLSVLSEIIQAREAPAAVALERAFACVFTAHDQ